MRAALLLALAACSADPAIRCTTAEQCLDGQTCMAGTCATASSLLADGGADDASPVDGAVLADGLLPLGDAPATDARPGDAATGQCNVSSECPLTTPCCVNHACQLLGC